MKKTETVTTDSLERISSALLPIADSFSFVVREETEISDRAMELVQDLSIYLIKKEKVNEWPGTILLDGAAEIYIYNLNRESAFLLSKYDNELFNWIQPDLPEDIVFYKNGTEIFVSITHERDAYFELEKSELEELSSHDVF